MAPFRKRTRRSRRKTPFSRKKKSKFQFGIRRKRRRVGRSLMPQLRRAMTRFSNKQPLVKGLIKRQKIVTLKWCQMIAIGSVASDFELITTLNANGPFDPNFIVGGNQISAYGFTDYAAAYNKYKVIGATMKATQIYQRHFGVDTKTDDARYYINLTTAGDNHQTTTIDSFENEILTGNLSMKNVKQNNYMNGDTNNGVFQPIVLTRSWALKNWKKELTDYDKEDFWIDTTGDPNGTNEPRFQFLFHIDNHSILSSAHSAALQATQPGPITNWMFEIVYKVIFRDPKPMLTNAYQNE